MKRHTASLTVLTSLLVLTGGLTYAQKPLPGFLTRASLKTTPTAVRPGAQAELVLTLNVQPGYHIYANKPGDKFLTPTTVTPQKVAGIQFGKITWPRAQTLDKAQVYEKTATIRIPIRVEPGVKPGAVPIVLNIVAQGCNATDCFPPARFSVSAPLRVQAK